MHFRRRFISKVHAHYRHELVFFWRFSSTNAHYATLNTVVVCDRPSDVKAVSGILFVSIFFVISMSVYLNDISFCEVCNNKFIYSFSKCWEYNSTHNLLFVFKKISHIDFFSLVVSRIIFVSNIFLIVCTFLFVWQLYKRCHCLHFLFVL